MPLYADPPFDLSHFHNLIGNDPDLEALLIEEFLSTGEASLRQMKDLTGDPHRAEWRAAAHALKGACYNMGANDLAALCSEAQKGFEANRESKEDMLARLTAAFAPVTAYFRHTATPVKT